MSDLPSRESFKRSDVTLMEAKPILAAYVRGELKTDVEWREAIDWDYEAMSRAVVALRKKPWGHSVDDGMTIVAAAIRVTE